MVPEKVLCESCASLLLLFTAGEHSKLTQCSRWSKMKHPTWKVCVGLLPDADSLLCILFQRSRDEIVQSGGTEVRCGREVSTTVVALLSGRLEDSSCLTVSSEVEQRYLAAQRGIAATRSVFGECKVILSFTVRTDIWATRRPGGRISTCVIWVIWF